MPTQVELRLLSSAAANSAADTGASLWTAGGVAISKNLCVGETVAAAVYQSTTAAAVTSANLTLGQHYMVEANATAADVTLTLPQANSCPGRTYCIVNTSTHNVTVTTSGGDCLNNAASSLLLGEPYARTMTVSNGRDRWYTFTA